MINECLESGKSSSISHIPYPPPHCCPDFLPPTQLVFCLTDPSGHTRQEASPTRKGFQTREEEVCMQVSK